VSNYNYIKSKDHQVYITLLNLINYYKIFSFKHIGYNIYYTHYFQNNILADMNKILEISENHDSFNNDKTNKYYSLEDVLKIIFNFKKVMYGFVREIND